MLSKARVVFLLFVRLSVGSKTEQEALLSQRGQRVGRA